MTHVPTSLVGQEVVFQTENDKFVVSNKAPNKKQHILMDVDRSGRDERTPLSPEHWRRAFRTEASRFSNVGGANGG